MPEWAKSAKSKGGPIKFIPWTAPALPQAATALADAYTVENTLDLAAALIVVPGGRAGRRLKEILVDYAAANGLRLVPPRITTVGALPEELYEPQLPHADPATTHRAWAHALRGMEPGDLQVLFPHLPSPGDLRGWISLGRQLAALQHEVGGAALRFDGVADHCDENLLFDDSARWAVLAQAQSRYEAVLHVMGRVDRDLARMAAVAGEDVVCDGDVWLIGLAELPVITRRMIERLQKRGCSVRILVHAPEQHAAAFDDLGCVVARAWLDAEIPLRDEQITVVEHPSNQATAAIDAINAFGDSFAADDIVLGVPDEEVIPYLEQRLAAAGARARYAGGTPVSRTPVYRLLAAVADLLEDHSFESLAALARHPALGDWLRTNRYDIAHSGAARFRERDSWLADMDSFCCERLPARVTDGLTGAGGRGRPVVEALLAGLMSDKLLGGLRGTRTVNEWMPLILELVITIYGRDPLSRDVPDDRRLIEACRRLRDAAAAQHRVPDAAADSCDVSAAIRILLDDVATDAIPADPDEAAIELLGWLELHLDDSPAAVLTGMNEPFVPQAVNAHAFLPNTLRARLGIEDNDRRYARDAYQLTAMMHARTHVHIIAGRRTVLGDPMRPSRLLLALRGEPLARRVAAFLEPGENVASAVITAAHEARDQSAFQLPPEPEIVLPEVPNVLSVTDFGRVLSDPYAFALEQVMGREGDDDAARELDALRFGSLAHRVLEQFARSPAASSTDESEVCTQLEASLDAHVAEHFGDATATAVRLQVEQLRLRLRAFAGWQARWIADGWRTVAVEAGVEESGVPFDVDGESFRIKGRIDRIDYNATTGAWAVFDYKTAEKKKTPAEKHRQRDGAWIDLQLPLYHYLLPHVRHADGTLVFDGGEPADVQLGYILLCGDPEEVDAYFADWSGDDLASALDTARTAVRILGNNIYTFDDVVDYWATADMKALLGHGRLVLEDDDDLVAEAVQ